MTLLAPIVTWDLIPNETADEMLIRWGHWLGGCNRPFGRQSFGLRLYGELAAVAVSASTVNARCATFDRSEVVELARLCAAPHHRDLTRVALRLWRTSAPEVWSNRYWPVIACVSYANSVRHRGDLYRFDGWRKVAESRAGTAGGNWTRGKTYEAKSVWCWPLTDVARERVEAMGLVNKETVSERI